MIGTTLGHYRITAKIGEGGMGVVYRANDERLDRDVAIKVLPEAVAGDQDRLRRFEREAKAVAALSHPNILEIHDFDTEGEVAYAVTELLEGESMQEYLLKLDCPMPWKQALDIAGDVAKGLGAAHSKGVVHRDIKPSNIFLCSDGRVKILDFGLAATRGVVDSEAETGSLEAPLTHKGTVMGTVGYMAPEQVRGEPADNRSDIFALGCVLYEMLSSQRAFKRDTTAEIMTAILREEPLPLGDITEGVPPDLDRIVARALAKDRGHRYASVDEFQEEFDSFRTRREEADRPVRARQLLLFFRRPAVAVPIVFLLVAFAFIGVRAWRHRSRVSWAHSAAIPELVRLAEARDYWPAFMFARRIEAVVPDDTTLRRLRPQFAGEFKRQVLPPGAKVLARPRDDGEEGWVELGEATGKPLPAPLGYSVFSVQSPGFEPREFAMTVSEFGWDYFTVEGAIVLVQPDELPDGMVRMETSSKQVWFGLDSLRFDFMEEGHVASFFVDTHEVTNREYKRFLDAGGYERREYWREPFERDGKAVTWGEAMKVFRDATGRPGPSAWEVGTYPQGAGDLPVTGVSWYEATAYAAFAGKRLPSVYHAAVFSAQQVGGDFVPGSNFSGSLATVGSYRGSLNYWGLYDVAGNAREWCSNAFGGERFVVGGAADDPAYMFWNMDTTKSSFDRNPTTGFRCIKPVASDTQETELDHQIASKAPTDWEKEKPFSEDAWRTWRGLLSYAKAPLDARVEWTDDTLPFWRMEKVSFKAAYGEERVVAYLFLPRNTPPPWQTVVFWPGGYAALVSSSEDGRNTLDGSYWNYLVKDGRAVLYPILKGTFERGGHSDRVLETSMDHCILEAKDIFRSLDYLETRTDIQKDRIGYLGFSWGATAGPFVCAVEDRFKVAVLLGGGLYEPELLGFTHRCTTPTQMVNGRFDGYAENQAPLFRALATPADRKRHVVFDSDHSLSGFRKEIVKANLEWFDLHLGTVKPGGEKEEP